MFVCHIAKSKKPRAKIRRTVAISASSSRVFMLGSKPIKVLAAEPGNNDDRDRIIVSFKARELLVHTFTTVAQGA